MLNGHNGGEQCQQRPRKQRLCRCLQRLDLIQATVVQTAPMQYATPSATAPLAFALVFALAGLSRGDHASRVCLVVCAGGA